MAVVQVNEVPGTARLTRNEDGYLGFRQFVVVTDDIDDGVAVARVADLSGSGGTKIPRVGYSFPGEPRARCTSVEAQEIDGSVFAYRVDVNYSSRARYDYEPPDDPTQEKPIIRVSGLSTSEEAFLDKDGKAILNSAGDPFDPYPMMDVYTPVITLGFNVVSLSLATPGEYRNAINQTTFTIRGLPFAAETVKLARFDAEEAKVSDMLYFYVRVELELHINTAGWNSGEILDQGPSYKDGDNKLPFKDAEGNRIIGKLDGAGGALAPDATTFEYIEIKPYKLKNFAQLPGYSLWSA